MAVLPDGGIAVADHITAHRQFSQRIRQAAATPLDRQQAPELLQFLVNGLVTGWSIRGVQFEDNGCGMLTEIQSQIFKPFFTTKPVGQGTGLGLSISYSIIEKHHGLIRLYSSPGQGNRFIIQLPFTLPSTPR